MSKTETIIEDWGTPYPKLEAYLTSWSRGKYAYVVCDENETITHNALNWKSRVKRNCPRIAVIEQEGDTEITISFIKGLKESLFQALRYT